MVDRRALGRSRTMSTSAVGKYFAFESQTGIIPNPPTSPAGKALRVRNHPKPQLLTTAIPAIYRFCAESRPEEPLPSGSMSENACHGKTL